jgi:hypothetical protein
MKCVECRLNVTNCRLSVIVGRQEGVYGCEIRSNGRGKPSNAANKTLVSLSLSELSRGIVSVGRRCNIVHRYTKLVRGYKWVLIACLIKESFNEVGSKAQLIHVDRNSQGGDAP